MFQTQEKDIPRIRTQSSIEQISSQQKNQQFEKIEKSNSTDNLSNQDNLKREWTLEEENLMFQLHNQHGNKWAIIAQQLKGRQFYLYPRTDNSVKNHFYSRLRKGLRKINKTINFLFKKSFKQFKIIDLYKVIEASDEKFKENKTDKNQFAEIGHDLKNRLFLFAEEENEQTEESVHKAKKLIDDLSSFSKDYKRKSKKNRRYSPMGPESVYRTLIKNQLHQIQSNKESVSEESQIEEQNPQNSKPSMVELRKTHLRKEQKSLIEKTEKICIQKQKNERKKSEETRKNQRPKSKVQYKHFSDEEEEEVRNEQDELREQKLDHFAENILRTFKSYLSFQSFRSNVIGDELFQ